MSHISFYRKLSLRRVAIPRRSSTFRQPITIRNSLQTTSSLSQSHTVSSLSLDTLPLTWYSCGPTVYDKAHLGHARTYICTDIIRRIIEDYFKIPINFALGITDIDDKIIEKARSLQLQKNCNHNKVSNETILELTRDLEKDFFRDMTLLNVRKPTAVLRVTEHINEIISYTEKIIANGNAYVTNDGNVYFNVGKCADEYGYGKLGPIPPVADNDEEVSINSGSGKLHQRDFALWKRNKSKERNDEPSWASPWGQGRPGWHIECSAMTHSYFGNTLDLHSGGVDLKFPHHTNEIAQCEAHNCSSGWVRFWLHTGHLYIEGRKMSKSLKVRLRCGR